MKTDAFRFLTEQPRQFGELLAYCEPLRSDFGTVWKCWTSEQPAKAPVFYVLEYIWACSFGNSVVTMRLLPALLGLLQLPAYFWLGMELFRSKTCAWLMVALQAISPIAVLYGQEAREYSAYTAMLAIVCAAFLRTSRLPSTRNWFLYGLTLTASFYVSFLTTFLVAAQFAFLIARREFKQLRAFIVTVVGATILFSPWIWLNIPKFIHGYHDHVVLAKKVGFVEWLDLVLCNYWMPLFYPGEAFLPHIPWRQKIMGLCATFYSLYKIGCASSYRGPAFLIWLLIAGSAPFICIDLTSGGIRATIVRYMLHVHLVVISCVAFAFAVHGDWKSSWKRRAIWWFAFISLCVVCIDSTLSISNTHTTILKLVDLRQRLRPLANELNRSQQPATLISDLGLTNHVQMFALCRIVKPKTKLIFVRELTLSDIPADLDQFYLFAPNPAFSRSLEQTGYALYPIGTTVFYRVRKVK